MQTCWLSRTGQPSCLLFFAGWGMDPEPFRFLSSGRHDLLMFYDYRNMEPPDLPALLSRQYKRLTLLAWSMGVWVAGTLLADCRTQLSAAVAVNGTLTPIDNCGGIPEQAYADMLTAFTPLALHDFYASMFADQNGLDLFLAHRPRRPQEEICEELTALQGHYLAHGPAIDIYTSTLAGSRDRIFPVRTQVRSWGKQRCRIFKAAHFPFYDMDWDDILEAGENRATG